MSQTKFDADEGKLDLEQPLGSKLAAEEMDPGLELLTDKQVQDFIVEGYLELPPAEVDGTGVDIHQKVFRAASQLGDRAERLGNNILPGLPELAAVFETPRCRGALTSLLGPHYMMHPHRFCHVSKPGRQAQTWHRDSFWGHWHPRSQCPYWIMALYFPQDTPFELGPTCVLPRSQYYNKDEGRGSGKKGSFGCGRWKEKDLEEGVPAIHWHLQEKPLVCRAGTIVLMHYDLWHRGPANVSSDGIRFMFKFQFSRMVGPSHLHCAWRPQQLTADWMPYCEVPAEVEERSQAERETCNFYKHFQVPLWQGIWSWLCGSEASSPDPRTSVTPRSTPKDDLLRVIGKQDTHNEPRRVAAARHLGILASADAQEVKELVHQLDELSCIQGRLAMEALEAAGPSVLLPLLTAASAPEAASLQSSAAVPRALGRCFDALGPASVAAPLDPATPEAPRVAECLHKLCIQGADDSMRFCAAEALGCVPCKESCDALLETVGREPVGDVRAAACHSLVRLLASGSLDEGAVQQTYAAMTAASHDADRYVAAYAAEACHRIEHHWAEEGDTPVPLLLRWCIRGDGW